MPGGANATLGSVTRDFHPWAFGRRPAPSLVRPASETFSQERGYRPCCSKTVEAHAAKAEASN